MKGSQVEGWARMKQCRRCNCNRLQIARESVTRRGRHQYAMCWYRCPECHDVSLSYRPLDVVAGPPTSLSSVPDADVGVRSYSDSESDPVLSR